MVWELCVISAGKGEIQFHVFLPYGHLHLVPQSLLKFWSAIKLLAVTVTVTVVVAFTVSVAVTVTAGVMLLYSVELFLLFKSATDIFNNCDAHPTHLKYNTYLHIYICTMYAKQLICTHTLTRECVCIVHMSKSHLIVGIYLLILICLCVCP